MRHAILSSGGIDSTTCLAMVLDKHDQEDVITISFDYGQKHDKELSKAQQISDYYGINHYVLNLTNTGIYNLSKSSLLKGREAIKKGDYLSQINRVGIVDSCIPFRNGLMLSAAASFCNSLYPQHITNLYLGAHMDDCCGSAYADCSLSFLATMGAAIEEGTAGGVLLEHPLSSLNKSEVVKIGLQLKAPYHLTWSCYVGEETPCGECATCLDRQVAFEANGEKDPIIKP